MCHKREPVKRIDLPHGYTCEVWQDESPSNPFEEWDGCVPLIVEGGRDFDSHDYGDAEAAILAGIRNLDIGQLESLAMTLDNGAEMIADAKEDAERYGNADHRGHLADAIEEAATGSKRLDVLEACCDALGWPCLNTCSRGYCQGDYVELLAVWLPSFGAEHRPDATPEQVRDELKAAVKLFGSWAWGDVYGFVVKSPDDDEVGSCWGFYGTDHKESGLLEEAEGEAEYHRKSIIRDHAENVKQWVRNHVPLGYRTPLNV